MSEEISLSSSEEADTSKAQPSEEANASKKPTADQASLSWEMRESIEITLNAQPEDTVTTEERFDITEVTSN